MGLGLAPGRRSGVVAPAVGRSWQRRRPQRADAADAPSRPVKTESPMGPHARTEVIE